MNSNDRLVGSQTFERVEHFHKARLVSITHGGSAIWLDPFGMLNAEIFVNLSLELVVGVDFMR